MTTDPSLLHLITQRLEAHGSEGDWPYLVLAALDGDGALDVALQPAACIGLPKAEAPGGVAASPRKVFLQEIRGRGFHGIGPESTLHCARAWAHSGRWAERLREVELSEAAEWLVTHRNMRWGGRSKPHAPSQ